MDTILIIEDDADLREGLEYTLSGEGYQILTAENAERGRKLWKTSSCDLILLDCNLPDGNGFSLCSEIRKSSDVFILMLTARDTELDEVKALEMGVDDYMSKPFSIAVLKARIKKLLSRKSEKQWISSNGIRLDKSSCQVICKEEVLELSKIEYKLLLYFLENPGQILSKEQILERIWDKDGKFVDENTVSVNIRRLRRKTEAHPQTPHWRPTGPGHRHNRRAQEKRSRYGIEHTPNSLSRMCVRCFVWDV